MMVNVRAKSAKSSSAAPLDKGKGFYSDPRNSITPTRNSRSYSMHKGMLKYEMCSVYLDLIFSDLNTASQAVIYSAQVLN